MCTRCCARLLLSAPPARTGAAARAPHQTSDTLSEAAAVCRHSMPQAQTWAQASQSAFLKVGLACRRRWPPTRWSHHALCSAASLQQGSGAQPRRPLLKASSRWCNTRGATMEGRTCGSSRQQAAEHRSSPSVAVCAGQQPIGTRRRSSQGPTASDDRTPSPPGKASLSSSSLTPAMRCAAPALVWWAGGGVPAHCPRAARRLLVGLCHAADTSGRARPCGRPGRLPGRQHPGLTRRAAGSCA